MTTHQKMERCFNLLDQSTIKRSQEQHCSYLDALIEVADDQEIETGEYSNEDVRRAMQLAILKGMKEHSIVGTGITPDSVAMFMAHLAQKFIEQPQVIFDPAVGSANLLTCVLNQYKSPISSYGVEVDSTLVRLAYVNSNLQKHGVELFHQDSLKPLYIPKAQLVISDLPVGIYPNLEIAKKYTLFNEIAEMYTHHLLIEQCINFTEENGYMILLIPNSLFVEQGAEKLRSLVTEQTHIQGILQLPVSLFQEGSIQKSIFILQKKGKDSIKPKQVLMASLPSFTNKESFARSLDQIHQWILTEVKKK
ncbi:class I SAM-dependent methyltransferase [Caldalkalibacillus mannanilyticus]|uniref:class I SAM-dependent methyltransferase n=1 Tax=Caldalkalibacillus mannanilyticus TaxID=1418 RepID=UPI0004699994|nr:class I SAM-dependent methyltransferase [Caldalkalibacillus mannanilyticus]